MKVLDKFHIQYTWKHFIILVKIPIESRVEAGILPNFILSSPFFIKHNIQ